MTLKYFWYFLVFLLCIFAPSRLAAAFPEGKHPGADLMEEAELCVYFNLIEIKS